jgi:hypothetical protein
MHDDVIIALGMVGGLLAVILPALAIVKMNDYVDRRARASLDDLASEFDLSSPSVRPGQVQVEMTAYWGFFFKIWEVTLRVSLPPDEAYLFVDRVHKHNLRYALFAYLGVFSLICSSVSRYSQRRSIRRQIRLLGDNADEEGAT